MHLPSPHAHAVVVNDVNLARWALRHALAGAGFGVTVSETAEEAVSAIARLERVDALVASLSLGPEAIDRLIDRVTERWPGAAVILLATDIDSRTPVATPNPAIVLDTPFSMDDVVAAVRRVVPPAAGPAREADVSALPAEEDLLPG